jgi:hypothetical protein
MTSRFRSCPCCSYVIRFRHTAEGLYLIEQRVDKRWKRASSIAFDSMEACDRGLEFFSSHTCS